MGEPQVDPKYAASACEGGATIHPQEGRLEILQALRCTFEDEGVEKNALTEQIVFDLA